MLTPFKFKIQQNKLIEVKPTKNKILTIPENVTEISEHAFSKSNCTGVIIPSSVKIISAHAFENSQLESVIIPPTVDAIYNGAFKNCKNLESVQFLREGRRCVIPECCFENCTNLKKISLQNLNFIESNAFKNCTSLEEFEIPDTIYYIHYDVFDGCTNLKIIASSEVLARFPYLKRFGKQEQTLDEIISSSFSSGKTFNQINIDLLERQQK